MQELEGAYFLALLLAGVQTGIWFDVGMCCCKICQTDRIVITDMIVV